MSEHDQIRLGRTLWAIADQLRGAMNADDFRATCRPSSFCVTSRTTTRKPPNGNWEGIGPSLPQATGVRRFLFYALERQDLASLSADSAVPGLNRNLAYMSSQILPPRTVPVAFDSAVQPLFQRTYESERKSRTLAALRDVLLPKLIRGEIRVKDAEQFLKERVP